LNLGHPLRLVTVYKTDPNKKVNKFYLYQRLAILNPTSTQRVEKQLDMLIEGICGKIAVCLDVKKGDGL
jgi:hypothetical protein